MKNGTTLALLAATALLLGAAPASAVELHGYWRSGIGGDSTGGGQTCLGLSQFGYKFRLGNECESYGEFEFRQNLFKDRSGVEVNFVGMLAVQTTQKTTFDSVKADKGFNDIALRQAWIGAKVPQLGGATLWAGQRFYRRNDVHIIDFYYWDTSGPGAGIQDVKLGPVKLAFAVFQSPNDALGNVTQGTPPQTVPESQENTPPPFHGAQARWQVWRPDLRIYDIPFPVGNLEVGLVFYVNAPNSNAVVPASSGGVTLPGSPVRTGDAQAWSPWFTVQHFWPGLLGGFNKLAVQWASGSAAPMTAFPQYGNSSDSQQFRVVEQLVVNPIEKLSGMLVLTFHDIKERFGGATGDFNTAKLWTFGLRPQYHVNDYFRVVAELGWQMIDVPVSGEEGAPGNRTLTKVTLAPTFTAGTGFFARPELRLFVSWFDWSEAAQQRNVAGFNTFGTCNAATTVSPWGCDTSGVTFGAQMEAWW